MRISTALAISLSFAGILVSSASSVQAGRLADGTVFFNKSPRLTKAFATYSSVRTPGGRYYFTFTVPDDAGEPLEKVAILQRQGPETIRFVTKDTNAFEGIYTQKGEAISVQETIQDEETRETIVTFSPPIQPGTTFTVGFKPARNPEFGDVYIYGVRTFPEGEKAYGSKVGFGRFHFYQDGDKNESD